MVWKLAFWDLFPKLPELFSCFNVDYVLLHTLLNIFITIWPCSHIRYKRIHRLWVIFHSGWVVAHIFTHLFGISVYLTRCWFAKSFFISYIELFYHLLCHWHSIFQFLVRHMIFKCVPLRYELPSFLKYCLKRKGNKYFSYGQF